MQRVGRIDDRDIAAAYDAIGRHSRARIERLLPADWSWEGRRVLDFGCGAGRTLRHFLDEAEHAEFHGCDIDDRSIAWLSENLSPPFHVFQNGESPGLPSPDRFFDVAYALSVFTHLGDHWADWLLELRRVRRGWPTRGGRRRSRGSSAPRNRPGAGADRGRCPRSR
jgi:SAM-dependent methyltransferase